MVGGGRECCHEEDCSPSQRRWKKSAAKIRLSYTANPAEEGKKGRIEGEIRRKAAGAVMQCCSVPGWQAGVGEIAGLGEGVGDRHWIMGETRRKRGGGAQTFGLVWVAWRCLQAAAA